MTTCCWKFWKFCLSLNRTRLQKIRRPRSRDNYIQVSTTKIRHLFLRVEQEILNSSKNTTHFLIFVFQLQYMLRKPTESWHKAVKNMSKRVTKDRFTLHWNCCEDVKMWKCRRRFKLFVGLFVDLLDSLKQGTTGDWILMTQILAPAHRAWVFWLCWLCWCSGNYTVKHKRVFICNLIWMNCTVMNLYSHSALSLQTTLK